MFIGVPKETKDEVMDEYKVLTNFRANDIRALALLLSQAVG